MIYSRKRQLLCLIVLIIVFNAGAAISAAAAGEILWYYPPTPQGDVGVRRPTVLWTFSGLASERIKEINMTIDGRKEAAVFKDELNSVYYRPQQNLSSGRHRVSIVITLKSGVRISSPSFSFNILNEAFEEVPITPVYEEVKDRINYYRAMAGLADVTIEASLNAAANSHGLYVIDNLNAGHFESNKRHRYFTGEMPWDRTRYFGYMSPMVAENIHFLESHIGAVDDWMDSLYHRLPIINPMYAHVGYGFASKNDKRVNVLEIGAVRYSNLSKGTVMYPVDGQRGVPLTWSGREHPDPLRLYPEADGPGGYPITLLVTGDGIEKVQLKNASIVGAGTGELDFYSFDSLRDSELLGSNAIALIPKDALAPGTTYKVNMVFDVIYGDGEKENIKKEWNFTTGKGGFETYLAGDNVMIYINGSKKTYKPEPFLKDERVMVPVRDVCGDLGADIDWNGDTYTVKIIREDNVITFDIGDKRVLINNRSIEMDLPAELINGTTFVPVRFISEALGYNVIWDGVMRMVIIQGK